MHHAFLYISLPLPHDYDVKMPNFTFYGGRKQAITKVFCFTELEFFLGDLTQESSPTFDKVNELK